MAIIASSRMDALSHLQVKIRPFINFEQTTTAALNPESLAPGVYISACLSFSHLAHVVLSLNGKTKMLFIWGWSQWKDITHLMGRNSFIVNIVWENVIAQHLLQNIFEAICCSRQGAVVNWLVWQEKKTADAIQVHCQGNLNHSIIFLVTS